MGELLDGAKKFAISWQAIQGNTYSFSQDI